MSDQERELTPEQEADVRRLLAEARATEPVPPDVAARLDRVMVGLGEERRGDPPAPSDHVVAPDWRRHRATVWLVAAAAVVLVGFGIGQIGGPGGDDSGASGSADESSVSADRGQAGGDSSDQLHSDTPDGDSVDSNESLVPESAAGEVAMPTDATPVGRVREASFTADANQLRRAFPETRVDGAFVELESGQLPSGYVLTGRAFECAPAHWGNGVLVPVFFDGIAAVLAYRPVTGESQVVELLQCGTGDIVRSTTLQAG